MALLAIVSWEAPRAVPEGAPGRDPNARTSKQQTSTGSQGLPGARGPAHPLPAASPQTRCAPRCRASGSNPAGTYPNEQSATELPTELPEQLFPAFIAQYLTHRSGD
jgi:hypothetical protein